MAGITQPDTYSVQVRVNGQNLATQWHGAHVRLVCPGGQCGQRLGPKRFPNDPAGNAYKCMRLDSGGNANLAYLGTDPLSYQGSYAKQTNGSLDDWSDLIGLTYALSATPDSEYVEAVNRTINAEQWLRFIAFNTLADNRENSIGTGYGDEYFMYRGVNDTRFVLIQHDLESMFGVGDEMGTSVLTAGLFHAANLPALGRLMKHPQFAPRYYWHLQNLIETTFSAKTIGPLIDQRLGSWVPIGTRNTMKNYTAQVVAFVQSKIPQTLSVTTAVDATTHYVHTATSTVSLTGLANAIHTRRVTVNGLPAVWTAWQASWTISGVPLLPGVNRVVIQAFDEADREIDRGSVDVWYNTGTLVDKSGTLAADEVWTAAGGPYRITATLTIPAGRTLTIEPGTTVFLVSGNTINLEVSDGGRILAEGTQYQQIRFANVPGSGNWGGVTIRGSAGSPETRIAYAFFEGNDNICIHTVGATLYLDHVSFGTTNHQYVSLDDSSFLISHCIFPRTTAEIEPTHGSGGIKTGGRGILRDCFFGGTTGYSDHFDFTGGNREQNEPILELYNNVFINSDDDIPGS